MAGYVKELLLDLTLFEQEDMGQFVGTDFHHTRLDLLSALEKLYQNNQINDSHILALALFLDGSSKESLFLYVPNAVELLRFCLKQLEHESMYTDDEFIQWALTTRQNYVKIKSALVRDLISIGDNFELA
jgi:hypothetical protein